MLANLVFVDPSSLSAAPIAGADLKALVTTGLISVGPITPEMLANVVPGEATALGPVTPIAGDHFTVAQIALEAAGPISPEALANVVPVSPTELSSFEIHIVGVNAGHTAAFQ
jgi:hypothetical protein